MRGDRIISVIDGRRYMTYKIHNNIYSTMMKWYLYGTHTYKAYFIARETVHSRELGNPRSAMVAMMVSEAHVFHMHTPGAPPVFVILYIIIINMATPE